MIFSAKKWVKNLGGLGQVGGWRCVGEGVARGSTGWAEWIVLNIAIVDTEKYTVLPHNYCPAELKHYSNLLFHPHKPNWR